MPPHWVETALMMYVSCALQADVTILLNTVRAFANKLRLSNPSGTLEQVVAELEISLNDSDSLASEVAAALLRVVKCLIETEITDFVQPAGLQTLQAFVNREDLIDTGVPTELRKALQTSASAYISLRDLESLVAMNRATEPQVPAKLSIREHRESGASEIDTEQSIEEVDPRSIVLAGDVRTKVGKQGKLKITQLAMGLVEVSETECTVPSCAYRVATDRITPGSQYRFGKWMMSIFECGRKKLQGLIVAQGHEIDLQLPSEEGRVFTVGRSFSCDVCLSDERVSRLSAEISYRQGCWELRNCAKVPLWKDFHRNYTIGLCESPAVRIRERTRVRVRDKEYTLVPQQPEPTTPATPPCTSAHTLNRCVRGGKFEFLLTVGRVEDTAAVLLTEDYHVLTMPLCLLPNDIKPAAVIRVAVRRDARAERRKAITDAQEAAQRLKPC